MPMLAKVICVRKIGPWKLARCIHRWQLESPTWYKGHGKLNPEKADPNGHVYRHFIRYTYFVLFCCSQFLLDLMRFIYGCMNYSGRGISQQGKVLHSDAPSHWPSPYPQWSLCLWSIGTNPLNEFAAKQNSWSKSPIVNNLLRCIVRRLGNFWDGLKYSISNSTKCQISAAWSYSEQTLSFRKCVSWK